MNPRQEPSPLAVVRFITFEQRERRVLEEVAVRRTDDRSIESVGSKLWRDGYILFNTQSRSISPDECLGEALEDSEHIILVARRSNQDQCLSQLYARNKRHAST